MEFENLPEGWRKDKLVSLTTKIGSGATPKGGSDVYLENGEIALIRSQNIYNLSFSPDGLAYIEQNQANKLANVEVKKDDVLLNITGDSVARVCLVPDSYLPARVNQHVAILRADSEKLNARYLQYFLVGPTMQMHMLNLSSAGATRKALTKGMIEDFTIPIPPLPQQQKIASILGALDDKIELNNQMNQTLETVAKALFKSWFVDFDPFADGEFEESEFGMIPKGWKVGTLGEASVNHNRNRKPISKMEREKIQGIYPYYGAASAIDYLDLYKFDGVYLLIAEDGTVMNDNGNPTLQYVQGRFSVSNHAHILTGARTVSTEFLNLFLSSFKIKPYVTGSVQLKINKKNLDSIPLIIPSDDVLMQFNVRVKPMFEQILSNEFQISTLSTMRDSLLSKLMSGEIELSIAEAS